MIIPNPIGTRSSGSQPFLMAIVMKRIPIAIMARFCQVALANPVKNQNCLRFSMIVLILCYLDDFRSLKDGVSLVHKHGGDGSV